MTNLDGLKSIADHIERVAATRGVRLHVTTSLAWQWTRRTRDPLPTYQRGRNTARLADPSAIESWLWRQRFAICSDEQSRGCETGS
jgi:hypothetical protein